LGLQVEHFTNNSTSDKQTLNNNNIKKNLFDAQHNNNNNIEQYCQNKRVLATETQRQLCEKNAKFLELFARAAKLAIDECQHQFKYKRWNCTIHTDRPNVFGKMSHMKSRETAFIYSLTSAAAMYEITKACSRGDLKACSCEKNKHNKLNNDIKTSLGVTSPRQAAVTTWSGCSDNVLFGHRLSKLFVDSVEKNPPRQIRISENKIQNLYANKEYRLMNLHNNEVGRRVSVFFYCFELLPNL
jgi:hypothetical protein